jgi:hypothetical protein
MYSWCTYSVHFAKNFTILPTDLCLCHDVTWCRSLVTSTSQTTPSKWGKPVFCRALAPQEDVEHALLSCVPPAEHRYVKYVRREGKIYDQPWAKTLKSLRPYMCLLRVDVFVTWRQIKTQGQKVTLWMLKVTLSPPPLISPDIRSRALHVSRPQWTNFGR